MTRIHDMIDDYDIPSLNRFLHLKSNSEIDQPNEDGIYPIEYVISKFDPEKHNVKTHCVLVQMLLNKGCNIDKDLLDEIKKEDNIHVKTKQLIEMILEMKPSSSVDKFTSKRNMVHETIKQTKNRNMNRTIMPKSNYSDQELLQLQQCAERNGVVATPINHLALRIINHLERLLEQYGHYN